MDAGDAHKSAEKELLQVPHSIMQRLGVTTRTQGSEFYVQNASYAARRIGTSREIPPNMMTYSTASLWLRLRLITFSVAITLYC